MTPPRGRVNSDVRQLRPIDYIVIDNVFFFVVLVATSAFCWVMVLKPTTRRKLSEAHARFWRFGKEDLEVSDTLSLAVSLIGALFFSLVTIVFVVVGLYRRFAL